MIAKNGEIILQTTLFRNRSFWGIITTQFLGAFNDNLFKMLLMLICVDYAMLSNQASEQAYYDPYQTSASILFAVAFLLFSGVAGYLSDKHSKRTIIVISKVAEIVVMAMGLLVFLTGEHNSYGFILILFAVLFFMGTQSAFFGPSKYGILPELFPAKELGMVNGFGQATTFVSIILGAGLAGILKDIFQDNLWIVSSYCVVTAVIGTFTSTLIRKTPIAEPSLKINKASLFIEKEIWARIFGDPKLKSTLFIYSIFWFVGGVVFLAITLIGKVQLNLGDMLTGIFSAIMGLGIGAGCVAAAKLSKNAIRFSLVAKGCWLMFFATLMASLVAVLPIEKDMQKILFGISLLLSGFFGGWIAVPLQVFIQFQAPEQLKGRVIAAMNLITWIGILLASFYYFGFLWVTGFKADPSWMLVSVGAIMLIAKLVFMKDSEDLVL